MSDGFDAFVGNPPWVSYAGRAAQPLEDARWAYFAGRYESFNGYRNLQGVFVERCATLLRPAGRLGVLVPSSMSEQKGYGPTRVAHDRLCACDAELPDLGEDAFSGVFQPCMVLRSTRRSARTDVRVTAWPVERPDLSSEDRALLAKMTAGPALPAHLFGERGVQTSGDDMLHVAPNADATHTVALRVGGDIQPFRRGEAELFAEPDWFGARLRSPAAWGEVRVLIRQTASMPIAALSNGAAFRNTILAGFQDSDYPAEFLVAYLNATPIRWLHYVRHRDARQGMPQMKIGHLRAVPAPPRREPIEQIERLGAELSRANIGIDESQQAQLDGLVADAFQLSRVERHLIRTWCARTT